MGACKQHNADVISSISEKGIPQSAILNLCIDIPEPDSKAISDFFLSFPGEGTDYKIAIEMIPQDGTQRQNTLTRIRTEILAGEGPDIFICSSDLPDYERSALFPFPRQLMERRTFLPLDNYIQEAQYMEWDKLLPPVMEAGRNDEGQFLLPLTYGINVFMIEKEAYTPKFDYPKTWKEMAETEEVEARILASSMPFYNLLGEFADYESDALLITEEELLSYSKQSSLLFQKYAQTPSDIQLTYILDGCFVVTGENGPQPINLEQDGKEYWMLSGYNLSGGITADIITYAGINRNTSHPKESFLVLDYLLYKNNQANSLFFSRNLPVHMDLYSQESPWHTHSMSQWNFEQFTRLREEINVAKFYTPLDKTVRDAWSLSADADELRELVHKQYVHMEMLLAES